MLRHSGCHSEPSIYCITFVNTKYIGWNALLYVLYTTWPDNMDMTVKIWLSRVTNWVLHSLVQSLVGLGIDCTIERHGCEQCWGAYQLYVRAYSNSTLPLFCKI
jgi:hypothetical protein